MVPEQTGQWLILKAAAAKIGRSTARVRQYVHEGKLGEVGVAWRRNEMGNLEVNAIALEAFLPPERGNTRATGVSVNTQLRHVRATMRIVQASYQEGDRRRVALGVLTDLVELLTEKVAAAGVKKATRVTSASEAEEDVDEVEDDDLNIEAEGEVDFDEELLDL